MADDTEQLRSIIEDCQKILASHLEPTGPDAKATISELLKVLDGPRARSAGVARSAPRQAKQ